MAPAALIHIVCSDRARNGKTLLARVLVDYLLLDGRDPFVIDAGHPEGRLRDYFPGRTALVDFGRMGGRVKLFDTILAAPGRDYVIDLPAPQTAAFFAAESELGFFAEARKAAFRIVIVFVVDRDPDSTATAQALERVVKPDLMAYARNEAIGSSLDETGGKFVIDMPAVTEDLLEAIGGRRFSLRAFLLGDEAALAPPLRNPLKSFLLALLTAFREIEPALRLRQFGAPRRPPGAVRS